MQYLILDCETTGLDNPGVVEIAWIEVDKDLNVIAEFDSLVNPEKEITAGAEGVHGISQEMVENEPVIGDLRFPDREVVLLVHNISFDRPLVDPYMNVVAGCDTLTLARRMLPNCENHQLSTLQAYCELPKTIAHRAPGDCRTVLALLEYLVEGSGWSLIKLINYSNVPKRLEYVNFGKHKGKRFEDLPKPYVNWMRNAGDWDIDIAHTLKYI